MYDDRIIIPPSLRKEVLECLHSAHQGTVGMKARARSSVLARYITRHNQLSCSV